MKLQTLVLGVIGLAAALTPVLVYADTPGRHPAYLRARSDLRRAQFLLRIQEEANVTGLLIQADKEVEAAIREIDHAAVLDGKNIDEHPRVDTGIDRRGRFHKIVELLRGARADLGREEDNGRADAWRDGAYRQIDNALDNVRRAAVVLHWDRELGF